MFITTIILMLCLLLASIIPAVHKFINVKPLVGVIILTSLVLLELLLSGVFWQTVGICVYAIFVIILLFFVYSKQKNNKHIKLGQKAFAIATSIFVVLTLLCLNFYPVSHYSGSGFTGIGLKRYTVVNKYRMSPMDEQEARKYVLNIYYPTDTRWSMKSNKYGYDGRVIADYLKEYQPMGVLLSHIPQMHSIARRDATLSLGKYPVVVISPDEDQLVEFYEEYAYELVKSGYIVAIINHPYISNFTMFNDGEIVKYNASEMEHELLMRTMTDDIVDAIDVIENLSKDIGDDFFKDAFDFNGMTIIGHGLGAAASINASFDDKRIKQVAILDPNIEPINTKYYEEDFNKPLLVISSKEGYDQSMTRLSKLMRHVTKWSAHYKNSNESQWPFTNQGSFTNSKNCVNETILLLKNYMNDRYTMIEQEYKTFEVVYQK